MRIAFISTILGYPWGGGDKRWTLAAKACLDRGDAVFLGISPLTADHPLVSELVERGAVLRLRRSNSNFAGRADSIKRKLPFLRGRYLEGQLRQFRPDVVFLLLGGTFDALAEEHLVQFLQREQIAYVASCSLNSEEATFPSEKVDYLRDFFRGAGATLFMSSHNMQLAESQLSMPIPRARLIQNPLIIANQDVLPWPHPAERPQLGFVGRIDIQHKGLDLFLRAMARVHSEHPFDFHLTGRCEDPEAFGRLVNELGLREFVHVHPHAVGGDLLTAYGKAELVVLTSRWEGCASTMLEAMMAGRPQLATAVGGVPDWLTDGDDAFIAEDVTVESIEHALLRALSSRNKWAEMGRAARRAFDAKRDPNPVETLVGILEEAVGKRREAIGARLGA